MKERKPSSNTVSKVLNAVGSHPVSVTFKSNGVGVIVFANGKEISFRFEKTGNSFIKSNGERVEDGYSLSVNWNSKSLRDLLRKTADKDIMSSKKLLASRDRDLESDGVEKRRKSLTRPSREDLKGPTQKRDIPRDERDNDIHNDKDMKVSSNERIEKYIKRLQKATSKIKFN